MSTLPASNPTSVLLRERAAAHEQSSQASVHEELYKQSNCIDTRYSFYPSYCYVEQGKHWPINAGDGNIWAGSMENDTTKRTSVNKPPHTLWDKWRNEKRRNKSSTPAPFSAPYQQIWEAITHRTAVLCMFQLMAPNLTYHRSQQRPRHTHIQLLVLARSLSSRYKRSECFARQLSRRTIHLFFSS